MNENQALLEDERQEPDIASEEVELEEERSNCSAGIQTQGFGGVNCITMKLVLQPAWLSAMPQR